MKRAIGASANSGGDSPTSMVNSRDPKDIDAELAPWRLIVHQSARAPSSTRRPSTAPVEV
jgi:hypothetical protein